MTTLVAFLVALAVLVFVHELGHYSVARWFDVKVLRFSIGFGKPWLRWRSGPDQTEWTIGWLPFGGFVRMLDEREAEPGSIDPRELHRAFTQKSPGVRSAIVLAGPTANFLLAIALYAVVGGMGVQQPVARVGAPPSGSAAAHAGLMAGDQIVAVDAQPVRAMPEVRLQVIEAIVSQRPAELLIDRQGRSITVRLETVSESSGELRPDFLERLGVDVMPGRLVVGAVLPQSSAAVAGLQEGDEIRAVDGVLVAKVRELVDALRARPGRPTILDVVRGGQVQQISITPQAVASDRPEDGGRLVGRIGAALRGEVEWVRVQYSGWEALLYGVRQTWDMSWFSLRMLGKMVLGELSWRNLSGPVAIADYAGQSARVGWLAYLTFLALISVSLGVLNLLPVPVLDGGHLVYYGLEAMRGRPLSDRVMELSQKVGLGLILALMAVALFNDLSRLFGA
jgi:regulator of sigma E protease